MYSNVEYSFRHWSLYSIDIVQDWLKLIVGCLGCYTGIRSMSSLAKNPNMKSLDTHCGNP